MSVTVPTTLQRQVIMSSALVALRTELLPLGVFSTVFDGVTLEGSDKISVPYYPLESSASTDFVQGDGYVFGDTYTQAAREVTINKRKYQPLSIPSSSLSRQPGLGLEEVGRQKGLKLAADAYADILSVVTAANYGAAVFTGAAAAFDFAQVNETVGGACDVAGWPTSGRGLVLKSGYYRNLVTDLIDASLYASDDPVKRGMLQGVAGFNETYNSQTIPANAENLVGFAAAKSALIVAFSPIQPADEGRIVAYDVMTDPETGISIEYRKWFDADLDTMKSVVEVNYGYAVGEAAALKRIVSA